MGKSIDDLLTIKNLGEPGWKIYKAINLPELVNKAIEDNDGFLELTLKEQRVIIDSLAKEEIKEDDIDVIPTLNE